MVKEGIEEFLRSDYLNTRGNCGAKAHNSYVRFNQRKGQNKSKRQKSRVLRGFEENVRERS